SAREATGGGSEGEGEQLVVDGAHARRLGHGFVLAHGVPGAADPRVGEPIREDRGEGAEREDRVVQDLRSGGEYVCRSKVQVDAHREWAWDAQDALDPSQPG